jgi:anhydro-N-acetylmuramic acid kinase
MDARGERLVVGCMTGTSIDGLDAALVRVRGAGLGMQAEFVRGVSGPLGELGPRLRAVAEQVPTTAGELARLMREFGQRHVEVVRELLEASASELKGGRPELICVHGQTVFHQPPASWQMINGPLIGGELRAPVVFDLRAADLAAGGQGAPITPLADLVLFGAAERRAVVNLGGFVNITLLPERPASDASEADQGRAAEAITGGDVCAANHILDTIARRTLGQPFDADGQAAMSGHVHDDALDDLMSVFATQRKAARSLGTGDEVTSWIGRQWKGGAGVSGPDLCATACEAIGATIARWLMDRVTEPSHAPERIIVAGGGTKNAGLKRAIASCCSARVQVSGELGVPADMREAACFAVLGAMCADGVPITLPAVTGGPPGVISGVWSGLERGRR